jgi:uncharacterized protein VirK/YbjX
MFLSSAHKVSSFSALLWTRPEARNSARQPIVNRESNPVPGWSALCRVVRPRSLANLIHRFIQGVAFISNVNDLVKLYLQVCHSCSNAKIPHKLLIVSRFLGGYLARGFSIGQRLQIITNHFAFINSHVADTALRSSVDKEMAIWSKRDARETFSIVVKHTFSDFYLMMEGDLVLEFRVNGRNLFQIVFTIVPGSMLGLVDKHVILIGGSQGRAGAREIRHASKSNCEICPLAMLVVALKSIGRALNISTVAAVTSSNQVNKNVILAPQNHLSTYDLSWESVGACAMGNFISVQPSLSSMISEPSRQTGGTGPC